MADQRRKESFVALRIHSNTILLTSDQGAPLERGLCPRVMDAPRRKARRDREKSKFVYDPHGRRILRKSMGAMRTGPPVEAAMPSV